MIDAIQPLADLPGVTVAALVSDDGVPVAMPGRSLREGSDPNGPCSDRDALAALSAGWMDELTRAVGGLSWDAPRRVVMRAARGTLLMLRTTRTVLVVVLEGGLGPEQFWLPMEGAVARIQRKLRAISRGPDDGYEDPPAPLPGVGKQQGAPAVADGSNRNKKAAG